MQIDASKIDESVTDLLRDGTILFRVPAQVNKKEDLLVARPTFDGWALGGRWRWRPEPNPWRSLARAPRAAELPRALYENACVACYGGEAPAG